MNNALPKSLHHIRESIMLLVCKIFLAFLFLDGIYITALFILSINPWSQYYSPIFNSLIFGFLVKFLLHLSIIFYIVLRWATTVYYISERQIILHSGIIDVDEDIYELSHIRTVKLHQSILGKIFNYGTIVVTIAVSGYHENRTLSGISDPNKYEHILREHIQAKLDVTYTGVAQAS